MAARVDGRHPIVVFYGRYRTDDDFRQRVDKIDSFRSRILSGNPDARTNLSSVFDYTLAAADLAEAKVAFGQNDTNKGLELVGRAMIDEEIRELVFGKMSELSGHDKNDHVKGSQLFFNPNGDLSKKVIAVDHALQALQTHWTHQVVKDLQTAGFIPQDEPAASPPPVSTPKTRRHSSRSWLSLFTLGVLGVCLALFAYLFKKKR